MIRKKTFIIHAVVLLLSGVILTIVLDNVYNKHKDIYAKSTVINKASQFFVKDNSILEITPDKKLYEHNFNGKARLLEENTKAIFIENNLKIENDGSIYINEKKITTIEGAISGSYNKTNLAVITEDKELYTTRLKYYFDEDYNQSSIPSVLEKVPDIKKAKKVICCDCFTYVLTEEGDVYRQGKYLDNLIYEVFTKIDTDFKFTDISGSRNGLILLDQNNIAHLLGSGLLAIMGSDYSITKLDDGINKISDIGGTGCAVNKTGSIIVWGVKYEGKGYYDMIKVLKNVKKADNVLNNDLNIFAFEDNVIVRVTVDNGLENNKN